MKKQSLIWYKKKAWEAFSVYIRTKYADWRGNAVCVTCNRTYHWKKLQAGHFIAGRGNAILFEENNVHPQCYGCNVGKHGNQLKYYRFMVSKYGEEEVQRLEKLNTTMRKFTIKELQDMRTNYQTWTLKHNQ